MNIRIDVYHHFHDEAAVTNKLDAILGMLKDSRQREVSTMKEVDLIGEKTQKITSAVTAIEVTVTTMAQTIRDLSADPVKLLEYADSLDVSANKLATLALENTPAAPPA